MLAKSKELCQASRELRIWGGSRFLEHNTRAFPSSSEAGHRALPRIVRHEVMLEMRGGPSTAVW